MSTPIVWTVIVAAGSGTRFGGPKHLVELAGRRVLDWSIEAAISVSAGVVVVVAAADRPAIEASLRDVAAPFEVVAGGSTRSESVRCGLAAVPDGATIIVIHDGARPAATAALFDAVVAPIANDGADAVIPVVPVVDTIRWRDGTVVDRDRLVAVQTPQAFNAALLRRAHSQAPEATDDAALLEAIGATVVQVPGAQENQKLTVASDLPTLEAVLTER